MAEVQQQQELRDVLQAAQTALEEGRPQESIAACQHVLRHYPDAITALRLLGEACLEAGRSDEAVRAFDKAIAIDPHNVLARVGLGVIAEDRGEDERAIAQFRQAWEVEPTLPQLRGELVRLYRKRYGAGGRLRLTRVALANLHKRNDELLRAIGQLRQLHQEDPKRHEITLGLAEALWRHDEDDDAALLCHAVLAERPRTARALLILASIQGDGGAVAEQGVDELLATARGFDPDLTLTGELIGLRPSETLLAFASDVPTVPAFDPASAPIGGTDEFLAQGAGVPMPMTRWEDIASGLTNETSSIRSATSMGVVNGVPTAATTPAIDEVDELFAAIDRELAIANEHGTGPLPEVQPFVAPEAEEQAAEAVPDWQEPVEDTMMPAPDEPSAVERLTANWDNIDNELAAARPSDDAPTGMTGMLSALGVLEDDLVPFDVDKASQEEEETLKFDPSKFSLPPLDDEDDEDLALEIEAAAGEDEVAPFSLEAAGVRPKTSGLTFADLVSKQDTLLPSASGERDGAPDAEQGAVTAAASIFATRELSSLPEDQLLELHAATPETGSPPEQPASVADLPPIAEEAQLATVDDGLLVADAVPPPPISAVPSDESVASAHLTVESGAGPEEEDAVDAEVRTSSSTSDLDQLLSTDAPRMVAPPPADHYPVDSTRPLLADEALLLGIAAATPSDEDHLVSKIAAAPAEGDEVGMDKLFNRLRHRKQEQIQTGELLVNRRLQSSGTPGADTGEIAGPLSARKKRERRLSAGDKVAAQAVALSVAAASPDPEELDPPAETTRVVAEQEPAEVAPAGDTTNFLAALTTEEQTSAATEVPTPVAEVPAEGAVDDSWLTALVGDAASPVSDWAPLEAEPSSPSRAHSNGVDAVTEPSFAELLADTAPADESSLPVSLLAPAAADDRDTGLPQASFDDMPEQPEPPASSWASSGANGGTPHWGDETIDQPERLAADGAALDAASAPLAPINGQHAAPAPESLDSVVMRVRATAAARAAGSVRLAPRQTEQLAQLSAMVEAQPENYLVRLTLAVAYVSSRLPDQALNEYRRLIKESDELVPEVIERLKEMIADGDAPARAHRVLGDAYMKLGQFDLAMAEFQRAMTTRLRVAR